MRSPLDYRFAPPLARSFYWCIERSRHPYAPLGLVPLVFSCGSAPKIGGGSAPLPTVIHAAQRRVFERHLFWALIALACIAVLMLDPSTTTRTSLPTAANIARGHGYVFNAGGERIETGSSLLWQYLLVVAYLVHLDLLFFAKAAGLLFGAASLYVLWRIGRDLFETPFLGLLPPLLLCVTIPFYGWVQRGLETSLYVFSILLLALFLVRDRLRPYWYLPAVLVVLSRSEGFIVFRAGRVLSSAQGSATHPRHRRRHRSRHGCSLALHLLLSRFRSCTYYVKIKRSPASRAQPSSTSRRPGRNPPPRCSFGLAHRDAWNRSLVVAVLRRAAGLVGFRTVRSSNTGTSSRPFPLYVWRRADCGSARRAGRNDPQRGLRGTSAFTLWLALLHSPGFLSINEEPLAAGLRKLAASPSAFAARLVTIVLVVAMVPIGRESPDGIATWATAPGTNQEQLSRESPWCSTGWDRRRVCWTRQDLHRHVGPYLQTSGFAFTIVDRAIENNSQEAYRRVTRLLSSYWPFRHDNDG
jgi:hypothetical protein